METINVSILGTTPNSITIRNGDTIDLSISGVAPISLDMSILPFVPTKLSQLESDSEHRTVTDTQINKWNDVSPVVSVNGKTGEVYLDSSDIAPTLNRNYVTDNQVSALSGVINPISASNPVADKEYVDTLSTKEEVTTILSTGHISGGFVTPISGVTLHVQAGTGWITDSVNYFSPISWPDSIVSTVADGPNFVYVSVQGVVFCSTTMDDYYNNIQLAAVLSGGGNTQLIDIVNSPFSVSDFPLRVLRYQEIVMHAIIGYGCDVIERSYPNYKQLQINSGALFINYNEHIIDITSNFTKLYLTSDYGWIPSTDNPNQIVTGLYNDTTKSYGSALVPLTDTYWKKDLVLLTPSNNVFVVTGQNQYPSKDDALNSPLPSMPEGIASVAAFLCVVVSQKEDVSIADRIVDIRPYLPRLFRNTQNVNKVPAGGVEDQILTKVNSTDFNATWKDNAPVGLDKQIQFNDGGKRGADPNLIFDKNNKTLIINGATPLNNNPLAVIGDIDSYVQVTMQNANAGTSASSDYVATSDNGNDLTNFVDLGITSSAYAKVDEIWEANDSYLFANGGNLTLGTDTQNKKVLLHTGGVETSNIRGEIDDQGVNLASGHSFRINNYDIRNLITTASNATEEANAFALGSKLVIRLDLL